MTNKLPAGFGEDRFDPVPPDTKPINPKDAAAIDRVPLDIVPSSAIIEEAMAFLEGHLKYGAYNWRVAGVQVSIYVSAARRHLDKYWNGQTRDPKTNVHELASVRACCAVLLDSEQCGNLTDDRPPRYNAAGHLEKLRETVKKLNQMYPKGPGRYTEIKHEKKEVATLQPPTDRLIMYDIETVVGKVRLGLTEAEYVYYKTYGGLSRDAMVRNHLK